VDVYFKSIFPFVKIENNDIKHFHFVSCFSRSQFITLLCVVGVKRSIYGKSRGGENNAGRTIK
jgi:hypothetical protein